MSPLPHSGAPTTSPLPLLLGRSQSSRRVSEVILAGCIPVFLGPPFHTLPMAGDVDYRAFSVSQGPGRAKSALPGAPGGRERGVAWPGSERSAWRPGWKGAGRVAWPGWERCLKAPGWARGSVLHLCRARPGWTCSGAGAGRGGAAAGLKGRWGGRVKWKLPQPFVSIHPPETQCLWCQAFARPTTLEGPAARRWGARASHSAQVPSRA
jgi:hypothetical protein